MFGSLKRSFWLAKESFRVLRHDPELMLLTAASFIGVVIVAALAGYVGLATGAVEPSGKEAISPPGFALFGLAYFVGYFIIIYFQVALVCSVQLRMSGGDPNVWYGIAQANRRLGAILSWTLIAATVGLILRILESSAQNSRGGMRVVASIILRLIGVAWGLLVFFVIPVIAAEGIGGIPAIRRSYDVVKRRWGEAIVGTAGMGIFIFLVIVVAAGPFFAIGLANFPKAGDPNTLASSILIAIGSVIAIVLMVFSASLNSTYRAVLFSYANTGETGNFAKDTLENAFRSKDIWQR